MILHRPDIIMLQKRLCAKGIRSDKKEMLALGIWITLHAPRRLVQRIRALAR